MPAIANNICKRKSEELDAAVKANIRMEFLFFFFLVLFFLFACFAVVQNIAATMQQQFRSRVIKKIFIPLKGIVEMSSIALPSRHTH